MARINAIKLAKGNWLFYDIYKRLGHWEFHCDKNIHGINVTTFDEAFTRMELVHYKTKEAIFKAINNILTGN